MPKYIFAGIILSLLLTSCGDITQEMWLKEDGSGELHFAYDVSQMLSLYHIMSDMSQNTEENKEDIVSQLMDEIGAHSGSLDSTISFFDLMPEERGKFENPGNLKNIRLNVKANRADSSVYLKVMIAFESFDQLDELVNMLGDDGSQDIKLSPTEQLPDFSRYFSLSRKSFKIKTYSLVEIINGEPAEEIDSGSMDISPEQLMETGNLINIFHFPYRVKSCSNKNAEVHGNTVSIIRPLSEIAKMKEYTGWIVKFKKWSS
jgi:hypothetical protein